MTLFVRLLSVDRENKGDRLLEASRKLRAGQADDAVFNVPVEEFFSLPGQPFSYWVSSSVRAAFEKKATLDGNGKKVKQGVATADDFRFLRLWWESFGVQDKWFSFAKGGSFSPFYGEVNLLVNWKSDGGEIKNNLNDKGEVRSNVWMLKDTEKKYFFKQGLTWPSRPHKRGWFSIIPRGGIFSHTGTMLFVDEGDEWAYLAVLNSDAYIGLLHLLMPRGAEGSGQTLQYEVGYVGSAPVPELSQHDKHILGRLSRDGWSLMREMDSVVETSHAFYLPSALNKAGSVELADLVREIDDLNKKIDDVVFALYGFSKFEQVELSNSAGLRLGEIVKEDGTVGAIADDSSMAGLLSWVIGVSFGRFDWRLATGEREAPPEPEPFDPLPAKSPGMLPDDAEPYHRHTGILVDDPGHEHDLPRLMADVLETVDAQVDEDLRRWLRRDFFKYHLQQYSKSRRKASIYWPLATASSSYTLWLYYPDLTDQTLFTAVNDFVEPKLKQVDSELGNLRLVGASRSRADEKRLQELSDFRDELADLRDTLLKIVPGYKPDHDDGVQITAAPLWPLFRHRPWQNVLRETWEKLEQGDYDWAHLAMAYWPERVREKCVTDKSLAIAHDLEHLYVEPEPVAKKARGRKKHKEQ